MFNLSLTEMLITIPGILLGFSIHEYAHARMAYHLGDDTAASEGRMTLNFLRHIDPIGFLMLILAGFGWAKPVRFNPAAFKSPKRDEILVALAGPFSNLVTALFFFVLVRIMIFFGPYEFAMAENAYRILMMTAFINLGLFVFNMIPIPPLDGSHLYMAFLKQSNSNVADNLSRYGFFALFAIIMVENQTGMDILHIMPAVETIGSGMMTLLGMS